MEGLGTEALGMEAVGKMVFGTGALGKMAFGVMGFGTMAFGSMALGITVLGITEDGTMAFGSMVSGIAEVGMKGGGNGDTIPGLCLPESHHTAIKRKNNDDLAITLCDDNASQLSGNIGIYHYRGNNLHIHRHLCP